MGLCTSIGILSDEVESQLGDLNEHESRRLNALRNMQRHYENMRLDEFDTEFKSGYAESDDENRKSFKCIEILAELAYENMYVAYSVQDTKKTYDWLKKELAALGLSVSGNLDISAF